jgi:hypothetical protein
LPSVWTGLEGVLDMAILSSRTESASSVHELGAYPYDASAEPDWESILPLEPSEIPQDTRFQSVRSLAPHFPSMLVSIAIDSVMSVFDVVLPGVLGHSTNGQLEESPHNEIPPPAPHRFRPPLPRPVGGLPSPLPGWLALEATTVDDLSKMLVGNAATMTPAMEIGFIRSRAKHQRPRRHPW